MNTLVIAFKEGNDQTPIIALAKELQGKGHNVTLLFSEEDTQGNTLEKNNVPIIHFKWLKQTKNKAANMFFGWELKKLLAHNKFDAIYFNSPDTLFGILEARVIRPRIKLIFTIHAPLSIHKAKPISKIAKFISALKLKFLLSQVDEIIQINKKE